MFTFGIIFFLSSFVFLNIRNYEFRPKCLLDSFDFIQCMIHIWFVRFVLSFIMNILNMVAVFRLAEKIHPNRVNRVNRFPF